MRFCNAVNLGNIGLFKINDRIVREKCKICSKLTIRTPGWSHWRRSGDAVLVSLLVRFWIHFWRIGLRWVSLIVPEKLAVFVFSHFKVFQIFWYKTNTLKFLKKTTWRDHSKTYALYSNFQNKKENKKNTPPTEKSSRPFNNEAPNQ